LISPKNFFGIDTNKFGLELAKIALSIGRKLSADEFGAIEQVLPFDDLEKNFSAVDALFYQWPEADVIIGNPPFLGGQFLRREKGDTYAEKIYSHWPEVKNQPDYCIFWFRKAHESSARRIGLVGTNSVAQGVSRAASLDYVVNNGGFIHNAISTQEWSGEANVHVSIVNWSKTNEPKKYLDNNEVKIINSSLKSAISTTSAKPLEGNKNISFKAIEHAGRGFVISETQAKKWIKDDKATENVLTPMLDANNLLNPNLTADWMIDFNDLSIEAAAKYKAPFEHVKRYVKPERDQNNRKSRKVFWWQFGEKRPGMRQAIKNLKEYFAIVRTAKYTIFQAVSSKYLPCDAVVIVASEDRYILGVLNSKVHKDWVLAQRSTLEDRTRYTHTTCFETFPILWNPPKAKAEKIRSKMSELEEFRISMCKEHKISMTDLYNQYLSEPTSQIYKLHHELDKLVCELYDFKYDEQASFNEEILELNLKMAQDEIK
jgi:Fe-S-cluster formation regulator IscX/YfhJ